MNENSKLVISIIVDIFGYFSYLIPFLGELSDIIFAPIEAMWIFYAYKTKKGAIFGFLEEILPFTDFIPACTIVHFMQKNSVKIHKIHKK